MAERETKHTPGPFKASKGSEDDEDRWLVVADNGTKGYLIATIENGQPGDTLETEEATAHLFAAAPEMLEVLQMVPYGILHDAPNDPQPCMCDQCKFHKAVKIALDKAEGRPLE